MHYQQKSLFAQNRSLLVAKHEDQWFDRKSIRVSSSKIGNLIVGFANADGGTIIVGIEDNGEITGVDRFAEQQNAIRLVPLEFTQPPVRVAFDLLDCVNSSGEPDHVLCIEIPPSTSVHRNNRQEVFKRHGDQNRKLTDDAVYELMFDKGERYFDDTLVPSASIDSLDRGILSRFSQAVGTGEDFPRALRVRSLSDAHTDQESLKAATVLLFGTNPEEYFPGAFIRVIQYDGTIQQPGTRLNISFDRRISGPLPFQIQTAEGLVQALMREATTLDEETGLFVTSSDVPRFAWFEAIVNAVTHRSYSMQGDHIRVSIFDDRIEIHNPGHLPGPVRIENIRHTRFSRNPRIARTLSDLKMVQELNEGVPRMFDEMERAGLPEPVLNQTESGFRVTLRRLGEDERNRLSEILHLIPDWMIPSLNVLLNDRRITTKQVADLGGVSGPTARRYLQGLESSGEIQRVSRGPQDPNSYWIFAKPIRGRWRLESLRNERTRKLD